MGSALRLGLEGMLFILVWGWGFGAVGNGHNVTNAC